MRELLKLHLRATGPRQWPLKGLLAETGRSYLGDRPVAAFRYEDTSGPTQITAILFVWPRAQFTVETLDSSPRPIFQTGNSVVFAWVEDEMGYAVVFKGGVPRDWEPLRRSGLT